MELPGIAALLAGMAGLLNAWSYAGTSTFATVQSGNLITAGYALAEGDWNQLGVACSSIGAFALGAAVDSIVITAILRRGREYSPLILIAQAALLAVIATATLSGALPLSIAVLGVSFVAGSQGNAFHRDRGMLYGNIAVTFVIQSAASLLSRVLMSTSSAGRQADLRSARIYGAVLLAFAVGGTIGYLGETLAPEGALWTAIALMTGLGLVTAFRSRHGHIDPAQNAPTP